MKVLLISPLPPPNGGIATWTEQYKEYMTNKIDLDILDISVIGERKTNINSKKNILSEFKRTYNIIKKLKYKITNFNPDLVHLNTSCSKTGLIRDYIMSVIIKKSKIKLIVNYRCNIKDQIQNNFISKIFLKKLAINADKNLVLNKFSKQYLEKLQIPSKIFPNFIDKKIIISNKKEINKELKILSFVGHVKKTKGVFEIIKISEKFPDFQFIIIGPMSEEFLKIKKPLNVKFLGPKNKSEVIDFLDKSDVFIFPSYTEGFSNSILEAMARGVPIITTKVGANEYVLSDKGALYCKIGDTYTLETAIHKILDFNIREKMSSYNIERVKDFTIDKVTNKLIEEYKKLI